MTPVTAFSDLARRAALHGGEIVREAGIGRLGPGEGTPRRLGHRGRRGERTRDPRAPARGHARHPDARRGVGRAPRLTATGSSTPSTAPRTSSTGSPRSASRSPWWRRAARSPAACTRRSSATPTWPPAARAPGSSATTSPRTRLGVSDRPSAQAVVGTGFPFRRKGSLPRYLAALAVALETFEDLRRPGAACLDLAWVACGRLRRLLRARPRPLGRGSRRPPDRGSRRRRHRLDRRPRLARGRHPRGPAPGARGAVAHRDEHRPRLTRIGSAPREPPVASGPRNALAPSPRPLRAGGAYPPRASPTKKAPGANPEAFDVLRCRASATRRSRRPCRRASPRPARG